jgi:hypothetical protein
VLPPTAAHSVGEHQPPIKQHPCLDFVAGRFGAGKRGGVPPLSRPDASAVGGRAPGGHGPVAERLPRHHQALHDGPRYSDAVRC